MLHLFMSMFHLTLKLKPIILSAHIMVLCYSIIFSVHVLEFKQLILSSISYYITQ